MKAQKSRAAGGIAAFTFVLCAALCLHSFADATGGAGQKEKEAGGQKGTLEEKRPGLSGALGDQIFEMEKLSADIEDKRADIKEREERYVEAKIKESDLYLGMKKRIKFMYEDGRSHSMLMLFLDSKNMSELLSKVEYASAISEYDRDMLNKYALVVKDGKERESAMKEDYQELALLLDSMFMKKEKLESYISVIGRRIPAINAQIRENTVIIDGLIETAEEGKKQLEELGGCYRSPDRHAGGAGSGYLAHPCPGAPVSSPFGWRKFDRSFHKGVDFAAPMWTPSYAAEEGTVVIAGWGSRAGNWVVINHGGGLVTKYMHYAAFCVRPGQYVSRGQQIGYVGNTGYSTGPHLHFQVEVDAVPVNPLLFL